jgi:formylglycine-generating enzyme required for sulfatase activity
MEGRMQDPSAKPSTTTEGMVRIPGGSFLMGSDQHYPEEAPAHKVKVRDFWIDPRPSPTASSSVSSRRPAT